MYKVVVAIVFVAVVISLWGAFYFLMRKKPDGQLMLGWLIARVALSMVLLALIGWGLYSGVLIPRSFGGGQLP